MRIGVTGENGFIGKNFCNLLRSKKIEHLKFERNETRSIDCETDTEFFVKECVENQCSTIVHLAGLNRGPSEIDILESHVLPTYWLSKHCLKHSIKLIVSGSRISIGYYGAGKKISKKIISNFKMLGLKGVYLSLPNVFGPYCKPNYNSFVTTILHDIAHKKDSYKAKISNINANLRLVHADDVCKHILKIAESTDLNEEHFHPGEFNVTLGDFCSIAMGQKPKIELAQKSIDSITQTLDWYKNHEI